MINHPTLTHTHTHTHARTHTPLYDIHMYILRTQLHIQKQSKTSWDTCVLSRYSEVGSGQGMKGWV